MSENLTVKGHLKPRTGATVPFSHRVSATFIQNLRLGADDTSVVPVPVSRTAGIESDQAFTIELAPKEEIRSPIALAAIAADGTTVGRRSVALDDASHEITIDVDDRPSLPLTASDDPTLGRPVRLTGRVIGEGGLQAPSALPVLIWGVPEGGMQADARPRVITQTQKDGYFSGDWPVATLESAFGTVSGGSPIPIPLDPDRRLPRKVILVTQLPPATQDDSCSCDEVPPRTPDAIDLVNNPSAFSTDLGGGQCVNLNTPNRVLEEFSYFKVVRTTQPEVKGLTPTRPPFLPPRLVTELVQLADAVASAPIDGGGKPPLTFDAVTARQALGYPENVTLRTLASVDLSSNFKQVTELVRAIACPLPTRDANLGAAIDWDNSTLPWQATTVAHGHLLHFKQVWRADGYSLGDLLYSLPLAPCQKKEIAVIDWERQETATRTEQLEEEEALSSLLSRDRDVSEIVGSSLTQNESGGSSTTMWGAGGGVGAGFIGSGFGIFGGVAGGAGGSSSTAFSDSSRSLSANSLQQIRDNTIQSASAIRDQRSTVVQTANQGETMRVETEVVANHNHCHAITVEYFEVLRHFQVSHELADVQECLFIPLLMTYFDEDKALRWREVLERRLLDPSLRNAFDSAQRVKSNWLNTDTPANRYSEEAPEELDGQLRISFILPRPRDSDEAKFVPGNWQPYQGYLWSNALEWWVANLERFGIADRDRIFREQAAPRLAENMIQHLRFAYITTSGGEIDVSLDATLVSRYAEGIPLYVSIRPAGGLPSIPREEIARFKISFDGDLPPDARVLVESGSIRYRTPHLTTFLFDEPRVLNDLAKGDAVVIATPLSRQELRNPREEDRQRSRELIDHLNKHLEYFHQILFRSLHLNHRYMLLDGFEAPDGSGRSIASVVENRLIGIVGNCLVMPVARGQHLDPTYRQDVERPVDLLEQYAPTEPVPPLRVSVPTRGVYAEAMMGACDACEKKDETRFWRWSEAPCPDEPTPIQPVSTASRATTPPDVTPTPLPEPIINIQNAPAVPDPTGLGQALEILGRSDLFRDVTGLAGNQRNALAALQGALNTAKFFGGKAADLAMQQETSKNIDRTLNNVQRARAAGLITDAQAKAITESALQSMVGQGRPASQAPQDSPAVQKAIDAAAQSARGEVSVTTPGESVSASFENPAPEEGQGATGATLVPQFDTVTAWASIALSPGGGSVDAATHKLNEPAASTATSVFLQKTSLETISGSGEEVVHWSGKSILDDGNIIRVDPADNSKFQVRLRGHVCYPADPKTPNVAVGTTPGTPVPVVAIVHGNFEPWTYSNLNQVGIVQIPQHNGPTIQRPLVTAGTITEIDSYLGYEYLQKELARNGIASISIDENVTSFLDIYLDSRADMFLATLDEWRRQVETDAKNPCHGVLDFGHVGFLGQSRGGDAVVRAAKKNRQRTTNSYGVKALCSLSPVDSTGSASASAMVVESQDGPPVDEELTYLVVYGALDGDIPGKSVGTHGPFESLGGSGFRLYDRATSAKAMVFVKGACHARFNTKWGTEPDVITTDPTLLNDNKHQEVANFYIGGFFRCFLGNEHTLKRRFTGDIKPPKGVTVSLQWSGGQNAGTGFGEVRRIDTFEDPTNNAFGVARVMPFGQVIRFGDLQVNNVPQGQSIPHQTSIIDADLTAPIPVPRVLVEEFPASDWDNFDFLMFRLGRWFDLSKRPFAGKPPHVRVSLKDDANKEATVTEAEFFPKNVPGLPFLHEALDFDTNGNPLPNLQLTFQRLETVRIPLSLFRKRGVDLKKVRMVGISLEQADNTHLFIDSLEIVSIHGL
jgi:hypothetical protein